MEKNFVNLTKYISIVFLLFNISFTYAQEEMPLSTVNIEDTIKELDRQFWIYNRKDLEKSLSIATRAYDLSQKTDNIDLKSITNYNLSVIYQALDVYDSALIHANQAIELDSLSGNPQLLGKSLSRLGSIFEALDNYTRALSLYYQSLSIKEENNDTLGIGTEYHRIANIYNDSKEYQKATTFYTKALEIFTRLNERKNIATTYNNLGVNYYYLNDSSKAREFYQKAMDEYLLIGDRLGEATGFNNLGTLAEEDENYDKALKLYKRGLAIRKELKDKSGISNSLTNIGSAYFHLDKLEEAERYQKEALVIAQEINSLHLQRNILGKLIDISEKQKEYEKAFNLQKSFQSITDSLFNESDAKRIIRIGMEYEFEKQEKLREFQLKDERKTFESNLQKGKIIRRFLILLLLASILIILLYFRFSIAIKRSHKHLSNKNHEITLQKQHLEEINSELVQIKEKLTTINTEKDRFFSIIAHDLKNPFNIMIGITSILASGEVKVKREEEIQFLKDLHQVATEGYKLLQNLLEWARIQRGESRFLPEVLDIKQLITESTDLLDHMAARKNINLSIQVPQGTHAYADKNMLSTVLRNLISNALKFTHKGGDIIIGSDLKRNYLKLYVKDNGIGISEKDQEKLFRIDTSFSNIGTEQETGTGLGLILCKGFVEQNGGKIWVESKVGEGCTFFFTIPLRPK